MLESLSEKDILIEAKRQYNKAKENGDELSTMYQAHDDHFYFVVTQAILKDLDKFGDSIFYKLLDDFELTKDDYLFVSENENMSDSVNEIDDFGPLAALNYVNFAIHTIYKNHPCFTYRDLVYLVILARILRLAEVGDLNLDV